MKKTLQKPTPVKFWWVFVLFGLVLISVILASWKFSSSKPEAVGDLAPEKPMIRRAIDGVLVPEGTAHVYPLAVMIENSIDAWPISGVGQSNLVWEAPVEAGITRLLAVFADGRAVGKIGPVRSARPYYVDWAEEFKALYAHVGGSPEALKIIPSRSVEDLNEFWNGQYFWRASNRSRPHNVYASTDLLAQALEDRNVTVVPQYESWVYKEDDSFESRPEKQELVVSFGNDPYAATWQYDREKNDYVRWQLGEIYREENNEVVRVKNVVVMKTKILITDEVGRRKITTLGEGLAWVFRDGKTMVGKWRRSSLAERTRFFNENEIEIPFNAGLTWIQVTDLWPEIK